MKVLLGFVTALAIAAGFILGAITESVARETTTLDEALERPIKIERYIDKENNVVCYWNVRHPADLECVQIRSRGWGSDAK